MVLYLQLLVLDTRTSIYFSGLGIELKPYHLQTLRQKFNARKFVHGDTYRFVALQTLYHVKLFIV